MYVFNSLVVSFPSPSPPARRRHPLALRLSREIARPHSTPFANLSGDIVLDIQYPAASSLGNARNNFVAAVGLERAAEGARGHRHRLVARRALPRLPPLRLVLSPGKSFSVSVRACVRAAWYL